MVMGTHNGDGNPAARGRNLGTMDGNPAARGRNRGTRWEHRNPIEASEPDKDRRRHAAYLVGAQAES
jgi:hypothetical protein